MSVNTVTGVIPAEQLGRTLMHQHFVFGYTGYEGDHTLGAFDHEAALRTSLAAAQQLEPFGVRSVVDATPNDLGRDPIFLREVSERTGLHIICSTGYYYQGTGGPPTYFGFRASVGQDIEEEIYEMFMAEICVGIGGTGIRAGVLKVASSRGAITDYERPFFRAAARAQRETGVPIITHTEFGTMGPEQADLLLASGANPEQVMIGHMDGNRDAAYPLQTLARGVCIAFDQCGCPEIGGRPTDEERIALLADLIAQGHARRIAISTDMPLHWLGRPLPRLERFLAEAQPVRIFDRILPGLERRGVTAEQIETLLVGNPRRLFGGT